MNNIIQTQKKEIRNMIDSKVRSLGDRKKNFDLLVSKNITGLLADMSPTSILLFTPLHDEPDISNVYKSFDKNVEIYFPFFKKYAIYRDRSKEEFAFTNLPHLCCVILPGRVFDKNGNRIGRGFGWYDRLLASLNTNCLRIGIGYHMQLVDQVTTESHDQKIDILVTEEEIIKFSQIKMYGLNL